MDVILFVLGCVVIAAAGAVYQAWRQRGPPEYKEGVIPHHDGQRGTRHEAAFLFEAERPRQCQVTPTSAPWKTSQRPTC